MGPTCSSISSNCKHKMKFREIHIVTEATRLDTCVARVADLSDFLGKMSARKRLKTFCFSVKIYSQRNLKLIELKKIFFELGSLAVQRYVCYYWNFASNFCVYLTGKTSFPLT